jgi:FHS family L-fucose permease-like MFS transporter
VPPILGAVADRYDNMGTAMLVPLCFFAAAWTYPLAVNFAPRYKAVVDAFSSTEVGVRDDGVEDPEKAKASIEETAAVAHDNGTTIR